VRSLPSCGLAVVLSFGCPLAAFAQDQAPSASDIALARSLGLEGAQLADAGKCADAIDKLQRAEALYHAPTILVRLGECQVAVGKIVLGTETLQRVVREALPAKAPKAFVDAQARAKKALDAALPKMARLKIHVEMPPGVHPAIKLDGEPISLAALDVDRPADPGPHVVEAAAPGFLPAKAETTLPEGGSGSAALRLDPDPMAQGQAPPGGYPPGSYPPMGPNPAGPYPGAPPQGAYPPAPPMAPMGSEGKGSKTVGYVLLGVGGAGVVVGSIFGGLALGTRKTLDSACPPAKDQCPASADGDIKSLKSQATVSTVGFIVGGAGLLSGLIVLVASKSPTTGESEQPSRRASIEPLIGPSSIGLAGAF
jgi:hypothetical protein